MSSVAILTPRAQSELRDALRKIARDNIGAARAMNDAVVESARRIGLSPSLGSWRPYLPQRYRVWSLTRFAYVIIYDATTDPVQFLRIVHSARDLPRLLARLPG